MARGITLKNVYDAKTSYFMVSGSGSEVSNTLQSTPYWEKLQHQLAQYRNRRVGLTKDPLTGPSSYSRHDSIADLD